MALTWLSVIFYFLFLISYLLLFISLHFERLVRDIDFEVSDAAGRA